VSIVARFHFGFKQLSKGSHVTPALVILAVMANPLNACAIRSSDTQSATPDSKAGWQLANSLCSSCHIVDTKTTAWRKDPIPGFPWIAQQNEMSLETLEISISSSHDRMPPMGLSDQQLQNVAAYILSLKHPSLGHKSQRVDSH